MFNTDYQAFLLFREITTIIRASPRDATVPMTTHDVTVTVRPFPKAGVGVHVVALDQGQPGRSLMAGAVLQRRRWIEPLPDNKQPPEVRKEPHRYHKIWGQPGGPLANQVLGYCRKLQQVNRLPSQWKLSRNDTKPQTLQDEVLRAEPLQYDRALADSVTARRHRRRMATEDSPQREAEPSPERKPSRTTVEPGQRRTTYMRREDTMFRTL